MAKRKCPFCQEKVKENATICKHCNSELPPLPPKMKWYQTRYQTLNWVFGVFFLLTGLVGLVSYPLAGLCQIAIAALLLPPVRSFVYSKTNIALPTTVRAILIFILILTPIVAIEQAQEAQQTSKKIEDQPTHQSTNSETLNNRQLIELMTPDEMIQNFKRNSDAILAEIDNRVKDYRKKLKKYYPNDVMLAILFRDRYTLTTVEKAYSEPGDEKQKKTLAKIKELRPAVEILTREVYAKIIEDSRLDEGFNVKITAEGNNKQILRYEYALMSRARAHNIVSADGFAKVTKDLGFEKIIFTDGFDSSWTYDLTEEAGQ